jgi:hypothetical protein
MRSSDIPCPETRIDAHIPKHARAHRSTCITHLHHARTHAMHARHDRRRHTTSTHTSRSTSSVTCNGSRYHTHLSASITHKRKYAHDGYASCSRTTTAHHSRPSRSRIMLVYHSRESRTCTDLTTITTRTHVISKMVSYIGRYQDTHKQ